jgi:hypothetical protein
LEDHVKLREVLSAFDNSLISDKDTAVELRSEVTDKFFATSHILIHKDVFELMDKRLIE